MTTTPQTVASRLAEELEDVVCIWSPSDNRDKVSRAVNELHRLEALVAHLTADRDNVATELAARTEANRTLVSERDQLRERVDGLEREVKHWMSNHTNEVARARILKERADMPLERVKAYELVETLRAQVDALTDSAAAKADRIDRLGEMVDRLYLGMQQAMAKLTTLLDEDQFAHIESIMTGAGITPPDVERLRDVEPAVRFCPGCGSVGAVPDTFKDCCPDGNHARMIPESLARRCNDLFYLALNAAQPAAPANSEPFGYFRAEPMGWTDCSADDEGAIALYERPSEHATVPLTDEQIKALVMSWAHDYGKTTTDLIRSVEAHHGICKDGLEAKP